MKLFTIDGVYIEKALGKLKTAWNAVLLNAGQTQLNIWPFKFGYSRFSVTLFGNTFTKLRICQRRELPMHVLSFIQGRDVNMFLVK